MIGGRAVAFELLALMQCFVLAALAALSWIFRQHPFMGPDSYSAAQAAASTGFAAALTALFALNVAGIVAIELRPRTFGWWTAAAVQSLDFLVLVAAMLLDRNRFDLGIWLGFAGSAALGVVLLVLVRRSLLAAQPDRT